MKEIALSEIAGLLKEFFEILTGRDIDRARKWIEAFKKFMRRENPWPTFMVTIGRFKSLNAVLKLDMEPKVHEILSVCQPQLCGVEERIEIQLLEYPSKTTPDEVVEDIEERGLERPSWEDALDFIRVHYRRTFEEGPIFFPHEPFQISGSPMHYVLVVDKGKIWKSALEYFDATIYKVAARRPRPQVRQ